MNKLFKISIAVIMIGLLASVLIFMTTTGQAKTEKHQAVSTVAMSPQAADNSTNEEDVLVAILEEEPLDEPKEENNNFLSSKKTTIKKSTSNGSPYYIKVNYQANTVTVYSKNSEGEYTNPCKAMVCSTGSATPRSGIYTTSDKHVWGTLIGGVYGHYSTRIVGSILFHSVPYTRNHDNGSIEYWEYDKLGTTASAGCVRLTIADAKWIYDNCPAGTQVEFYASSDPGPLGKPSAQKISNAEGDLKYWDPTDPDSNNPWRNKKEEKKEETKKEEPKPKTNTNTTNTNKNNTTNANKNNSTKTNNSNTTNNNSTINNTTTNSTTNTNTISNTNGNTIIDNNTTNDTNKTVNDNTNSAINNDDNNNELIDTNETL